MLTKLCSNYLHFQNNFITLKRNFILNNFYLPAPLQLFHSTVGKDWHIQSPSRQAEVQDASTTWPPIHPTRCQPIYIFPPFFTFSKLPLPRILSSGIGLSRKPSNTLENDWLPHARLDLCPQHILFYLLHLNHDLQEGRDWNLPMYPQNQVRCQVQVNTQSE